jgi:hypothetical protein
MLFSVLTPLSYSTRRRRRRRRIKKTFKPTVKLVYIVIRVTHIYDQAKWL